MLPVYPLVFAAASTDGAALANTTIATSILPASGIAVIPGGTLQVGSTLKITLRGRISTLVTSPGTLTLDLRFGSVIISAFGAIALNVTAQTNATWDAVLLTTIRTVGAGTAATALCTAGFISRAIIGSPTFNSKKTMAKALAQLIEDLKCETMVLSYNNESWLSRADLMDIASKRGHVEIIDFDFKRYVGSQIGVFNKAGQKVGVPGAKRNIEHIVIAGEKATVKRMAASLDQ